MGNIYCYKMQCSGYFITSHREEWMFTLCFHRGSLLNPQSKSKQFVGTQSNKLHDVTEDDIHKVRILV